MTRRTAGVLIGFALTLTACSSSTPVAAPSRTSSVPTDSIGPLGPTVISSPTQAYALLSQGFPNASCQPATTAPTTDSLTNSVGNGDTNYFLLFPSTKTVEKLSCDNTVVMLLGGIHDNVTMTPKVQLQAAITGTNWIAVWVDDPSNNDAIPGLCNFKEKEGLMEATVWGHDGVKEAC